MRRLSTSPTAPLYFNPIWKAKQVKSAVIQCFSSVEPGVVYSTNELLSAPNKNIRSAVQKSYVIYQFACHCDSQNSQNVDRASQRLRDRIKQHISKSIHSFSSAIGLYLLQNPVCTQHYDYRRSSILAQGRSPFHLSALEATFIKTSNPTLCRQTEFMYSLKIVH